MLIQNARFLRITEHDGEMCAAVEVEAAGSSDKLTVLFRASEDNDFDMVAVTEAGSNYEVQMLDNNVHGAYMDMPGDPVTSSEEQAFWAAREGYKEEILNFGSVREEILNHLADAL
ncbi:hypothetical protein [Paenibacillus thalictri]|uniref:Uncharacterized protein n=1 Tax=Paenibacillus thalictri TaxID=2527873 RepID=A0A4Q9E0R6_9BACL|nr:hypothetical protein [Paenibacillus thalictri]TBL81141.1 hypothetical protein EYB31_03340 [Paenibacillus thalictri]